jgi:mRNA interferase RelE/StbE
MGWDIIFDGKAQKQLLKLDIEIQRRIKRDVNEKLLMNPDYHLEGLEGEFKKYYKFRVGDYRLICDKQDNKLVIFVITVKHRREVYQ